MALDHRGSTINVAHGYTFQDIDRMARSACLADRSMASDAVTRYSIAWSGIAERLCSNDIRPSREELVRVGWQAIYAEVREMRHTFGQMRDDPNAAVGSGGRFAQYWTMPPTDLEPGVVERFAVGQILESLQDIYRDAVVALAVHEDYAKAAQSLGIGYSALTARMSVARKEFRRHWFAPEMAPKISSTDRRIGSRTTALRTHCRSGHALSPDNVYTRPRKGTTQRSERVCRACERERSAQRHKAVPDAD